MLRFAICEDEAYFAGELEKLTERYLDEKNLEAQIQVFASGKELMELRVQPDVLLMDIVLSGENGMDTVGKLRSLGYGSQVIFITAYKEYVFRAFDMNAVHYLIKPVDFRKLCTVLDKAVQRAVSERGKSVLITKGETAVRIDMKDILYCEVFGHQLLIHTFTEEYQVPGTMDSFEKMLDDRFFRCHRSFLVNMDFVADKREGEAVMAGGGRVLIARRRQQEFMRRLLRACRGNNA